MRRKPKVVTLDMPAEESETEDANADDTIQESPNIIEENDDGTPKLTQVRRGSKSIISIYSKTLIIVNPSSGGRLSQIRKISKAMHMNPNHKKQRRESQTQRARRISRLKEAESFGQCTIGKPLIVSKKVVFKTTF